MQDEQDTRRRLIEAGQPERDLAADTGPRWDTEQLQRDFEVLNYMAPFVVVRRRSDGVIGALEFTHLPRVYFAWRPLQSPDYIQRFPEH